MGEFARVCVPSLRDSLIICCSPPALPCRAFTCRRYAALLVAIRRFFSISL
jgi:hypothetical protein